MAFFVLRASPIWEGERTRSRKRAVFSAGFHDTADLLRTEVETLGGRQAELFLVIDARELPDDGKLRSTLAVRHEGVVVVFSCRHGRLRYACDRFDDWTDNLRAIALTLERLRKSELYGVVRCGEQYQGFVALPAPAALGSVESDGNGNGNGIKTLNDAIEYMAKISGYKALNILSCADVAKLAYRQCVRLCHPDVTGDNEKFSRLEKAWELVRTHFV